MKNPYSVPKGEAVSYASAIEYEKYIPEMTESVNFIMRNINSSENLIGDNPLSVMYENHIHHSKFMANIFKLNDYELLNNTLKWVLNSYISRGFKSEYFQKELDAWIKVINDTIDPNYSSDIIKIYQWMKSVVKFIEEDNKNIVDEIPFPFDSQWENIKNKFFNLLIKGNSTDALQFSKSIVHDRKSLENFYTKVITYSMYEIGLLWEKGQISVAQEHLATSIVMRIMSYLYMNFILIQANKGKAIITSSANELHEVGARIIADILELDGWNILYLGANTPNEELIKLIREEKPDFLGISVTMAFNLDNVKNLISNIRSQSDFNDLKILVGGYAFTFGGDSHKKIGADKISTSISETLETSRLWWRDKNESKYK